MSLLDAQTELLHLCVGNHADNRAELANAVQFGFDFLSAILRVLGSILGVGLLLALVPAAVAAASELFTQMLRENSGKSTQTTRSFDVADNTNHNHRRGLNDTDSIANFTLVHEGTGTVERRERRESCQPCNHGRR